MFGATTKHQRKTVWVHSETKSTMNPLDKFRIISIWQIAVHFYRFAQGLLKTVRIVQKRRRWQHQNKWWVLQSTFNEAWISWCCIEMHVATTMHTTKSIIIMIYGEKFVFVSTIYHFIFSWLGFVKGDFCCTLKWYCVCYQFSILL